MKFRALGDSGIRTSVVGFGVWTVSTPMWGIKDENVGIRLLRKALELGITFFDTADVYGDGNGETIIGKALGDKRDQIVIATKFGYDFYNHPGLQPGQRERPHDWSPAFARKALEKSLERLGTDHVDLYQLHNPRLDAIRKDDLWAELEKMKDEGKIRMIGAALGPALRVDRQSEEAVVSIRERSAVPQIIYNMLEQDLGRLVFPTAEERGVPVLVRVPHASGLLEGHFDETTEFSPDDHRYFRMHTPHMKAMWQEGLKKVKNVDFLTSSGQRTLGQAAIQYVLAEPTISSLLPNIYNEEQLVEFAKAPDTPALTEDELAKIEDLRQRNFGVEPVAAVA